MRVPINSLYPKQVDTLAFKYKANKTAIDGNHILYLHDDQTCTYLIFIQSLTRVAHDACVKSRKIYIL